MTKAAILIDGGYFLKRLTTVRRDIDSKDPHDVARAIGQLVYNQLKQLNRVAHVEDCLALLYRCFFYDAKPYTRKGRLPVSKQSIDYAKSPAARFWLALFDALRKRPNFAVRLGEVVRERAWILNEGTQRDLLEGVRSVSSLSDEDFSPGFRQKAVDMRIGIDIASLALKKQIDTIVRVAGDADFVPAAKLARREGVRIILDPLRRSVASDLFEHIDGLRSGFADPRGKGTEEEPS